MQYSYLLSASLLACLTLTTLPAAAAPTEDHDTFHLEHKNPLEPPLVKVQHIAIIGTQYEAAVRLVMHLHAGDEVTPEAIREDMQRIAKLGYFADVTPRLLKIADGYELVVYLRENPRLTSIQLLNDPTVVLSRKEIVSAFDDLKNGPLNLEDLQRVIQGLETRYRDAGYALAQFELVPSESGNWLDPAGVLKLRLNEGRIEKWTLQGNTKTEDQVILRELSLHPGDLFQRERFQRDLQRLINLGYFEPGIEVVPKPGQTPGTTEMVLKVKEARTADVGLNFNLNNRDGLLGGVHLTDSNFLGKGQYLNLQVQTGLNFFNLLNADSQKRASFYGRVDFTDPWLLPDHTALGGSLFSERTPLFYGMSQSPLSDKIALGADNGLLQTRTGVSLNMSRPLFGDRFSPWKGQVSFTAEQVGLSDFQLKPQRQLSLSNRFSATDVFFNLGGTLAYDSRDYVLNPHSGVYGSVSAKPVWGDGSYLKLMGNLSTYIPLFDPHLTLALGLQGGTFLGDQPIYEQFFGSGAAAIRGWDENGSLFGSNYLLGSIEARFPIYDFISGVLFTDVGNFFQDASGLNPDALKYGVGAGVRLQTPLGMLRLDYGIRDFQALSGGAFWDAGQLHFSIGQKF